MTRTSLRLAVYRLLIYSALPLMAQSAASADSVVPNVFPLDSVGASTRPRCRFAVADFSVSLRSYSVDEEGQRSSGTRAQENTQSGTV
jgi:hypothetical protein